MLRSTLCFARIVQRSSFASQKSLDTTRFLQTSQVTRTDERKAHTTVDAADVARHSSLLNNWWDPHGPMKALHSYNDIRVPFIRDGLVHLPKETRTSTPLKCKKILDIGCGGGILSEPLAVLGAEVTGVDASKELIELAKQHSTRNKKLENNTPKYICSSIEEHAPTHQCHYDGVVASEIIEHVDNKLLFIQSCLQTLKPGGKIFFTTPNRTRLSQICGIYLAEYVFRVVPKGTHQYEKFITPNELSFILERNNCHVEKIHGAFYHILTNKWQFTQTQAFIYALQAVKHD